MCAMFESSFLTKRKRDKVISGSFINRIQNPTNPTTGYAPLLGIYDQSIINSVKTGQMTEYRRNLGACTTVDVGCPCTVPVITPSIPNTGQWATFMKTGSAGGENESFITPMATDAAGNSYHSGFYTTTELIIHNFVSVTGGTINTLEYGVLPLASGDDADAYLVKYDTNGQALWATNLTGASRQAGLSVATDAAGFVYVVGVFNSPTLTVNDFDGLSGNTVQTTPFTTLTNSGDDDVFIVKYNATTGKAVWATKMAGTTSEAGISVATDSSGNLYVTGQFLSSTMTIYQYGDTTVYADLEHSTGASIDFFDTFVVKYDTNGQALWASRIITGLSNISPFTSSCKVDAQGNLFVVGNYSADGTPSSIANYTISSFNSVSGGTVQLDTYADLPVPNDQDIYVVKYGFPTNGTVERATVIRGGNASFAISVATDSFSNVYVSGYSGSPDITIYNYSGVTSGVVDTSSPFGKLPFTGPLDGFLVKYDVNLLGQWATSMTGINDDDGAFGVATDSANNVFVVGTYGSSSLQINNYTGLSGSLITTSPYGNLTNVGVFDAFVIKYNSSGQAEWTTNIIGPGIEFGVYIDTDASGNVYVTGRAFDPTPAVPYTITFNNFNGVTGGNINTSLFGNLTQDGDLFIVKYPTP